MASAGYMTLDSAFSQVPIPFYKATASINLKTTGLTTLFSVPAGFKAFVQDVIIEITAATSPGTSPEVTVTTTGAGGVIYDQQNTNFPSQVGAVLSLRDGIIINGQIIGAFAPASSDIKLSIDTGATGTTWTATAHILGFVIPV